MKWIPSIAVLLFAPSMQLTALIIVIFVTDSEVIMNSGILAISFLNALVAVLAARILSPVRSIKPALLFLLSIPFTWGIIYLVAKWIQRMGTTMEVLWFATAILGGAIAVSIKLNKQMPNNRAIDAHD